MTEKVIAPDAFNAQPHDPALEELNTHLDELSRRYGYALAVVALKANGKTQVCSFNAVQFGGEAGELLAEDPSRFYQVTGFAITASIMASRVEHAAKH